MIKVGMVSLGCPKNTVDSEVMLGLLEQNKMQICHNLNQADVVVVNTCAFIESAKKESIDSILKINSLKETGQLKGLVVAGCLVNKYKEKLFEELTEADSFVGTGDVNRIVAAVRSAAAREGKPKAAYFSRHPRQIYDHLTPRRPLTPAHYGYLKISEGCSNGCKFCTIPMMRGRSRSRSLESLLEEARQMIGRGVKEINVIAQDTTDYGTDLYGEPKLPQLLRQLARLPGVRWVRLLYAFPAHVTDELIEVMAQEEKICRYLDMPIQHVDDEILIRMERKMNGRDTLKLIEKMRKKIPGLALRTTLIVGLPGETEEKFQKLLAAVQEVRFERLGVFTFSDEEHGATHRMPGQVPEKTKSERKKQLMLLQQEISLQNNRKKIGNRLEVLVERRCAKKEWRWEGRSQCDAPEIDGRVYLTEGRFSPGDFVKAKVIDATEYDLVATPENPPQ